MVQLLRLAINKILIVAIKIYRKYFSHRINKKCIYKKTCSKYALDLLTTRKKNIFSPIYKRYKSCRVKKIILEKNNWYIINGLSEKMVQNEINPYTKKNIEEMVNNYYL